MLARLCLVLLLSLSAAAEAPKIKTLFSYRQELGLTAAQVEGIKAQLVILRKAHDTGEAQLKRQEEEYLQLLGGEASLEEARTKLRQIADTTVEMRLKDFQVSRAITALLTAEQRRKWQEIRARSRARTR